MITLIAAVSDNGVIGDSTLNSMPLHCKQELQHFKSTTMGGTLVMGRVTAEQVGKLPGRDAIVLSNQEGYQLDGFVTMTIEQFLQAEKLNPKIEFYVCGGADIYKQLCEYCDKMIVSYMTFDCGGDVLLPHLNWGNYFISNYSKFDEFITYYYYKNELK